MKKPPRPISEQLMDELGPDHPLIRKVRYLEGASADGLAYVGTNNKFPRWPVQQWLIIIGFAVTTLVQVFGFGGRWTRVEESISSLGMRMTQVEAKVERTQELVNEVSRIIIDPIPSPPAARRTPIFGDETFYPSRGSK